MKKLIYLSIALFAMNTSYALAGNGKSETLYKAVCNSDVNLELERLGDEVSLYLYSPNMKNVETIIIEKSLDANNGFKRCKTIKVSDNLKESNNYLSSTDDMPYPANQDSYYRIRTITANGLTKVYNVVQLAPIMPVEPLETVEK